MKKISGTIEKVKGKSKFLLIRQKMSEINPFSFKKEIKGKMSAVLKFLLLPKSAKETITIFLLLFCNINLIKFIFYSLFEKV